MREPAGISEEHLLSCIQDQYNFSPVTLEFLPLGLDFNAGVYRAVNEQTIHLIKVTSRPLYEPRFLVPRYLNDQGIVCVVAPIPTRSGALWTQIEGWTVIVYPFIYGEASFTGMTDEQWKKAGTNFKQIHQVTLPPAGFESMRKETFDPKEYAQWVRTFETLHTLFEGKSALERTLRATWANHKSTIHMVVKSLEKLAEVLQSRTLPHVICHADLHPSNLIRDERSKCL